MSKKSTALVGGILIIAGGLILRDFYKKGKLKKVEDYLEPLIAKGKEVLKQKLEQATAKASDGNNAKANSSSN